MTKRERQTFSPEFRLETALLVVGQGYTHQDAAKAIAMRVCNSTHSKSVKQLREEREGKSHTAMPMTQLPPEICELKKRIERVELEKTILKKATVDPSVNRNTLFKSG